MKGDNLWGTIPEGEIDPNKDLDEYGQLTPEATKRIVDENINKWVFPNKGNIANKVVGDSIPDSLFIIETTTGETTHNKNYALKVEIDHKPTRGSTYYGEKEYYIPLWVTEKSMRSIKQIQQFDEDGNKTEEYLKLENYIISIIKESVTTQDIWTPQMNMYDFENGIWSYVNPEDRPLYDPGELFNLNDPSGMGFGDDPNTLDIDESKDDKCKNTSFKRKEIVSFMYSQTYWIDSTPIDPSTGEPIEGESVWEKTQHTIFTDAFYEVALKLNKLTESDIDIIFGINGSENISNTDKLLVDDTVSVWIKPQKDQTQSKWDVVGSAEYHKYKIPNVPGLELPETQQSLHQNFSLRSDKKFFSY